MLLSEFVEMRWNARNKKYYSDLGYTYTKMKDVFYVKPQELPRYSTAKVIVKCDYCGKQFPAKWSGYVHWHCNGVLTDCCGDPDCTSKKAVDVTRFKYGVDYYGSLPEAIEQRKKTCIERYGVENPFASDAVKEKIVQSNMRKYGVPYSQQSPTVRRKTEQTCLDRYGVSNYVELFAGKFIGDSSPVWKGGVAHSRVERATHEYVVWRNSVFKRDLYTCQCCGSKSGNGHHATTLNAHHIANWADNPDSRYDVDNGITLCQNCHNAFHSIYGKRNNTNAQLNRFIADENVC